MIRAIAIDDEPLALKVIENFCTRSADLVSLEKSFTQPEEGAKYLRNFPVKLIFLDINMPSVSGIEFYKQIEQDTMVIFTTAYTEYAAVSYDLKAVDYLVKPFTYERFRIALEKAIEYNQFRTQSENKKTTHIFIRADYALVKVTTADIIYIEALDDYLKIHLKEKKNLVARMTMKSILEILPADEFMRVHRSYIVAIHSMESFRNKAIKINGMEIPVGISYEDQVEQFFKVH